METVGIGRNNLYFRYPGYVFLQKNLNTYLETGNSKFMYPTLWFTKAHHLLNMEFI